MESVAASDDVDLQLVLRSVVAESNARMAGLEVQQRSCLRLEHDLSTSLQSRRDQILDHLLLAVDHDRATVGQLGERDPMTLTFKAQLEAMMNQAVAIHPRGDAHLAQQVNSALLEDTGAHARFDVCPRAVFEYDRGDAA